MRTFNTSVLLLSLIFTSSVVYSQTEIGSAATSTLSSSLLSKIANSESKKEFQSTCVTVSDTDLTCGGMEAMSTLETVLTAVEGLATTASKNAIAGVGGTAVNIATPLLTCSTMIKCDTSKTANTTCSNTCSNDCESSTTCESMADSSCVVTALAHSVCVQIYKKACIEECKAACTADEKTDNAVRNPESNGGSTSTTYVPGQDYSTCIAKTKPKAIPLQKKCRELCKTAAYGASSLIMQSVGLAGQLANLKTQITGNDGSGSGGDSGDTTIPPPTTYTPPDPTTTTTPTPYPGGDGTTTTQQDCSGKTGSALSQCSCSNLGKTWSSKGCVDSSSNNNLTLSNVPTGNDASGSGLPNSGNSNTKGNPSGTGPSGTGDIGANNSGLSDSDKNASSQGSGSTGSTNGSSLNGNYSSDNANSDELNAGSDTANSGSKSLEIAGKDVDLFAKISTTYTGLYNDKKLGFFASRSEEKSDKHLAKKKRVTRK